MASVILHVRAYVYVHISSRASPFHHSFFTSSILPLSPPSLPTSPFVPPSDDLLVMSGGAPLDQVDGYSVSIVPEKQDPITLQVTSGVRGMHVIEDTQSDRDSGIVNAGSDTENSASTTGMTCCHCLVSDLY